MKKIILFIATAFLLACATPIITIQESKPFSLKGIHQLLVAVKLHNAQSPQDAYLHDFTNAIKKLNLFEDVEATYAIPENSKQKFLILEFDIAERIMFREKGQSTSKYGNIILLRIINPKNSEVLFKAKEMVILSDKHTFYTLSEPNIFLDDHPELFNKLVRWVNENR